MGKNWLRFVRKEIVASCAALAVATGTTAIGQAQYSIVPNNTNATLPNGTTSYPNGTMPMPNGVLPNPNVAAQYPYGGVPNPNAPMPRLNANVPAANGMPAPGMTVQQQLATQQREIDDLKNMLQQQQHNNTQPITAYQQGTTGDPSAAPGPANADLPSTGSSAKSGDAAPFKVGYDLSKGMYFDAMTPDFPMTEDGKYPFELRIRGRIQTDYYGYKVTDSSNHLTGLNTGANDAPDESVLEVKRMRLIFAGYMFDPNLRYQIQFDGNTRGLNVETTTQGALNKNVTNISGATQGVVSNGGNVGQVDGGVRLLEAWVAYDFHGDPGEHGYRNTYSVVAGKIKPFGSFEEYLGSANAQFVEFGMSSWMFDADADNFLTGWGFQIHACEDRFFMQALVTNGSDNQVPNYNMDNIPGGNIGMWYDFGGTWDEKNNKWKLYGDSLSDIEYHCDPVARVGTAVEICPMGRRSAYTSAELDFFKASSTSPGAGGTAIDSVLGGGGLGTGGNFSGVAEGNSPFALDAMDVYTFNFFWAAKWLGFSIYNEWWVRDYDNFRGERIGGAAGSNPILYTSNIGTSSGAALLQRKGFVDIGSAFQTGYFLIPHKLEVAARYDVISGESGDINGNGTFTTVSATSLGIKTAAAVGGVQPANTVPVGTMIREVNGAFTHYSYSQEIAMAVNVFFYDEKVKWQTDFGVYTGGNPASNGQAPAGYIPGVNGYMVRSQIQFSF